MFVNLTNDMRADLVKQMVEAGCNSTFAHETIDLAGHAIDVAIEAVMTVCQRGSDPRIFMAAHPLALNLLSAVAEVHAILATDASRKAAEDMGLKLVIITDKKDEQCPVS